jgi:carbamoyltransferase
VNILGIWDGHDSGAALLVDGALVAAVNEERLSRRKLEIAFPFRSVRTCLQLADLDPSSIDVVATTTTDVAKAIGRVFPSTKESYYHIRRRKTPAGTMTALRSRGKYLVTEWQPNSLSRAASEWAIKRSLRAAGLERATLRVYDHHAAHAATAAFPSGFDACLVVTIDGLGDGVSATISRYRNGQFTTLASTRARHSPGVFFEHVTHLLNMRELEDEGKVMALADYAAPVEDRDNPMMALLASDGMRFTTSVPARRLQKPLRDILWRFPNEQFAFMAQRALERACVDVVREGLIQTGESRVALAGGVASNIKVNRRIRLADGVEDVFVFPHMGDGGLALGAGMLAAAAEGKPFTGSLDDLDLGPAYDDNEMESALKATGLRYTRCPRIAETVAEVLAAGKIVMWFQGRMEYGPRALGNRSVLARPDVQKLRDRINLVLKRRVWYQPFCPSILEGDARRLLVDLSGRPNRHMTMAYAVKPELLALLSGVTGVDGTCRPQIVAEDAAGPFAELLRQMRVRIGIGAVLNTSFNVHGSPLVCSPREAVEVFREAPADALAIGPFLVDRTDGP